MKKLNLFFILAFLLISSGMLFSQAIDRLYLSVAANGSIYDITGVPATFPTTAVPGAPAYTGGNQNLISNLAVGYDTPGGNPTGLVYLHSNTAAGSTIYKSGTSTGQTVTSGTATVGGIGTNNVPVVAGGNPSGESYGFSAGTKNLYKIYPTASDLGLVSGDAIWNAATSTIWATDTFFDYQNFVYVILQNVVGGVGTRYLYKVNPTTREATLVTPLAKATTNPVAANPVGVYNNTPTVSNATSVGGIRGLAYLNGLIYAVSVNGDPGTQLSVYTINISTGVSTFIRTYSGFTGLWATNQDLATVPYYIPFQFTCGGITQTSSVPFVRGVASSGQKFLNIPINSVYTDGTYTINVVGTDFTSSSQVNVTTGTTSIQVPLNYTGSGAAGLRTLQVNLSGSTTSCFVNVLVDEDTDGDGIGNSQDLDDDNDGILDTVEDACETEGTPVYSNTFTTGARTNDTNVLNHTYTTSTTIADGFYGVTTSAGTDQFYNQTDLIGGVDAGNPVITAGSTAGRYLAINIGPNLLYQPIYRVSGLTVTPGTRYRFRIDMAGLANGNADIPNLQILIKDTNGNVLAYSGSSAIGMANDDVWRRLSLNFVATTPNVVLEIVNYQASGTNGNDLGIDNIVLAPLNICDFDGDGIPNSQDFDSDNDGCFDAIEGSENVLSGQLNANGSINTSTTGGLGSTGGVNYGVPNLVNAGGAADTGNNVGQGIGQSQDSIKNDCLDTDSDGIPNWQDLDSDNDGILDIFECPDAFVSVNYSSTNGTVTNFSAPAADLGFIFDVYTLDNSFNLNINGTNLSNLVLEFQPDQTDNVRFLDGSRYGNGGIPEIYQMTGSAATPLVRIIIHKNGSVNMYGSKAGNGQLFPLQLYNGNSFNTIVWNQSGPNSIVLTQPVVGTTYITGRGQGIKNGFCDPDSDGISNQFDVDSDGDGCPDAIEGSEAVRYDQVNSLTSLPVTSRGQIKVTYNGSTTGTPAQIVSTSPSSNGVPQLVNYAGVNLNATTNPTNLAGLVDNTDGTVDVGQGIGTSQNAASRDVECDRCFRPATTPGVGGLATNQGFTALERAGGTVTEWPGKIKGAYTALDAKTKGFVINRVPTATLASIVGVPGMMVYDTTVNCLKIYDGTTWSCFSVQTCNNQ